MREKQNTYTVHALHRRDHPRECGKNWPCHCDSCCCSGSPPRVREKLAIDASQVRSGRITPASAGKTHLGTLRLIQFQDHPRECGKNPLNTVISATNVGSPPRVREKHYLLLPSSTKNRITPASAGKTLIGSSSVPFPRDHPRECGKNIKKSPKTQLFLGSPPRVREKLFERF